MRKYEVVDLRSIDLSAKPDITLSPTLHCVRSHGSEEISKTRQASEHQTLLKATECVKATSERSKTQDNRLEGNME
jgi:hypothetical protein